MSAEKNISPGPKSFSSSIRSFFLRIYEKLVGINDSPQKIAIGFGLGVFLGILPGAGPVASLVLAAIFRVNKAAAVVGSLLTNTWISIVGFILAGKIGAWVTGRDWNETYQTYQGFLKNFNGKDFFQESFWNAIAPIIVGYLIFSLTCGMAAYLTAILLLKLRKRTRSSGLF